MDDTKSITSPEAFQADVSLQAGNALFRLVRMFSRYPMRDQLMVYTGKAIELSRILVTEAVATVATVATVTTEPSTSKQEVTVGVVAERLNIDPSTASRFVAETISAGYLVRLPSQTDNRKIRLELTEAGRELVVNSHRYQQDIFEYFTRNWSLAEKQEFAQLLMKFVTSVTESRSQLTE